jgi:hypothetical protein
MEQTGGKNATGSSTNLTGAEQVVENTQEETMMIDTTKGNNNTQQ